MAMVLLIAFVYLLAGTVTAVLLQRGLQSEPLSTWVFTVLAWPLVWLTLASDLLAYLIGLR